LRYLIKNYQLIPFEHNSKNELDVIYQTSYFVNKFSNSDQKIGILYDKLIADNYIDCSKRTFSSIFFIKNNFPKVNWLESQSSFQFFILKLVENKKISCNCKWVVAAACFLIKGEVKTNIQLGKVENPSSINAIKIKECIKDFNRIVS
jgi:hypothetical protein